MMYWWNDNYVFRRSVELINPPTEDFPSGHPVKVVLGSVSDFVGSGKVRSDFQDVEIIYINDLSTPTYTRIPRLVEVVDNKLQVTFNTVNKLVPSIPNGYRLNPYNLLGLDYSYTVYYGNSSLSGYTSPTTYTSSAWPIQIAFDGLGVSYKKPNQDWKDGVSLTNGAEATFSFYGEKVRLLSLKGPSYGMAEIAVDDETPKRISLYADADTDSMVVFTKQNLTAGWHTLKIKASGDKSPKASDSRINIRQFDYFRSLESVVWNEELNPNLFWVSYVVGGVEK